MILVQGIILLPSGHLTMSGHSWLLQLRGCYWHRVIRDQADILLQPAGQLPNYPDPNVSSASVRSHALQCDSKEDEYFFYICYLPLLL